MLPVRVIHSSCCSTARAGTDNYAGKTFDLASSTYGGTGVIVHS
jgi:hypothetical protein